MLNSPKDNDDVEEQGLNETKQPTISTISSISITLDNAIETQNKKAIGYSNRV